jgi:hypothetical protein
MHSELFNLWLFAFVVGKVALVTGIGPGIAAAVFFKRSLSAMTVTDDRYSAAARDKHEGSRAERSVLAQQVRGGQLAMTKNRASNPRATSPPRKMRRSA